MRKHDSSLLKKKTPKDRISKNNEGSKTGDLSFKEEDVDVTNLGFSGQGQSPAAPQVTIERGSYVEAEIGQSLEVRCTAEGNPRPAVQWFKAHETVVTSPDGVLRFGSVTRSDEGEYTCSASNPSGTNTARVNIFVRTGKSRLLWRQINILPNKKLTEHSLPDST